MHSRANGTLVGALYIANLIAIMAIFLFLMADVLQTMMTGKVLTGGQTGAGGSVLENVDSRFPDESL
jgi:hypothetical protein